MKAIAQIVLIVAWIPSALASIFASLFLLNYFSHVDYGNTLFRMKTEDLVSQNHYKFFAALPKVIEEFRSTVTTGDARPAIVKTFLDRYNSPLANYSEFIVDVADKYEIDFRLIPAIAMQESTGCKYIPQDSYNCWGYGIYGDKVIKFKDYKEGIKTVSKGLKKNYIDKGLITPEEIMARYTPPSQGSWASAVEFFFKQMK